MSKTVLFVGLAQEQIAATPLPDGVESTAVATGDEAVDQITLAAPDLIVANDHIGELDSLDFFARVAEVDPDSSTPVIFLAPPQSGVQPFLYQRRRSGFTVRYVDNDGLLHNFFVTEPTTEKAFTVKPICAESLADEIVGFLSATAAAAPREENDADWENRIWEMGFNQDIPVEGGICHVQTEIVGITPVSVSVTVFSSGQALHSEQHKLKGKRPSLVEVRHQVEKIHAGVVKRLQRGEFQP